VDRPGMTGPHLMADRDRGGIGRRCDGYGQCTDGDEAERRLLNRPLAEHDSSFRAFRPVWDVTIGLPSAPLPTHAAAFPQRPCAHVLMCFAPEARILGPCAEAPTQSGGTTETAPSTSARSKSGAFMRSSPVTVRAGSPLPSIRSSPSITSAGRFW